MPPSDHGPASNTCTTMAEKALLALLKPKTLALEPNAKANCLKKTHFLLRECHTATTVTLACQGARASCLFAEAKSNILATRDVPSWSGWRRRPRNGELSALS